MVSKTLESLGIDKEELVMTARRVRLYSQMRINFILNKASRLNIPGNDIQFLSQCLATDDEFVKQSGINAYHPYLYNLINITILEYLLTH